MARVARVVAPGIPHHVTQRGNRRQLTFFRDEDFRLYRALISEWCRLHRVEIWAYCLMPNHVHLIVVPPTQQSLRLAIGEAHRRYTAKVNGREGWTGCLWQGRFFSYPMDDSHLFRAVNYVEMNPVRAGLCLRPEDYYWSSARHRIKGVEDSLISSSYSDRVGMREVHRSFQLDEEELEEIRRHARTGRPLGSTRFIKDLEKHLGRNLKLGRSGRPASKLPGG